MTKDQGRMFFRAEATRLQSVTHDSWRMVFCAVATTRRFTSYARRGYSANIFRRWTIAATIGFFAFSPAIVQPSFRNC